MRLPWGDYRLLFASGLCQDSHSIRANAYYIINPYTLDSNNTALEGESAIAHRTLCERTSLMFWFVGGAIASEVQQIDIYLVLKNSQQLGRNASPLLLGQI